MTNCLPPFHLVPLLVIPPFLSVEVCLSPHFRVPVAWGTWWGGPHHSSGSDLLVELGLSGSSMCRGCWVTPGSGLPGAQGQAHLVIEAGPCFWVSQVMATGWSPSGRAICPGVLGQVQWVVMAMSHSGSVRLSVLGHGGRARDFTLIFILCQVFLILAFLPKSGWQSYSNNSLLSQDDTWGFPWAATRQ